MLPIKTTQTLTSIVLVIIFMVITVNQANAQPVTNSISVDNRAAFEGTNSGAAGIGVLGKASDSSGNNIGVQGVTNSAAGYSGYFVGGNFLVAGMLRMSRDDTSPNIIGGHADNSVAAGVFGATIGGGGSSVDKNEVNDAYGTVGGGYRNVAGNKAGSVTDGGWSSVGGGAGNTASGYISTVAGGWNNVSSGPQSAVAGGQNNRASGSNSTVGGGRNNGAGNSYASVSGGAFNKAYGLFSTIPGGHGNVAAHYSFAAGKRAKALHSGAFVWGDSTNADIRSSYHNQVTFRARGGYLFFTNAAASLGARLNPGATAWVALSDRNSKEKIIKVDSREVLDKLSKMEITTWQYKGVDTPVRHMGPMAQDFYNAYKLGSDDKGISTLDTDGVALAAIQGLYTVLKEKEAEITELKARLTKLESKLN